MKRILLIVLVLFFSSRIFAQISVPGHIEAEFYSSMSGVKLQTTTDTGGGLNVGYIDKGDWMKYTISVDSPGLYTISFRIAALSAGAQFEVVDGTGSILTTVNVPVTGGYQTYQTISSVITLPSGTQTIQLLSTSVPFWNINWFELHTLSVTPPLSNPPISDSVIDSLIDNNLDTFRGTLDSVVSKTVPTSNATAFSVDTLTPPNNTCITYKINLQNENTSNQQCGGGDKSVQIKNIAGVYTIIKNNDEIVYSSESTISKASWKVVIVNNIPVVQVTGLAGITISWTVSRTQTYIRNI